MLIGCIPIIKPVREEAVLNDIKKLKVYLMEQQTTYFHKCLKKEKDYEEVLKEAQNKGYAEANPAADVLGLDIKRKLRILSSIAFKIYRRRRCFI